MAPSKHDIWENIAYMRLNWRLNVVKLFWFFPFQSEIAYFKIV